ncbi:NGFI-A-binding protein 1-like [Arapaima gigas]
MMSYTLFRSLLTYALIIYLLTYALIIYTLIYVLSYTLIIYLLTYTLIIYTLIYLLTYTLIIYTLIYVLTYALFSLLTYTLIIYTLIYVLTYTLIIYLLTYTLIIYTLIYVLTYTLIIYTDLRADLHTHLPLPPDLHTHHLHPDLRVAVPPCVNLNRLVSSRLLLQLTVNEAAAQLCMRNAALLTRRDELFSLARQVSREVTYKYTYRTSRPQGEDQEEVSPKRIKAEDGVFDLQEAMQAIYMRQEALREQLAHVQQTGDDKAGQNPQAVSAACLTHVHLEQLLARQMEMLRDTAVHERLLPLDWRIPSGALKVAPQRQGASEVTASEAQAECRMAPRGSRPRRNTAEGQVPLGRQLASELKRRHSVTEARTTATENGRRPDISHAILNLSDKKVIKVEPEETR